MPFRLTSFAPGKRPFLSQSLIVLSATRSKRAASVAVVVFMMLPPAYTGGSIMKTTTATEAARLLRLADKTIRDWLRKGRFPGAKLVKRNGIHQWSIPLADIEVVRVEEQKTTESEGGLPSLPELAAQLMA